MRGSHPQSRTPATCTDTPYGAQVAWVEAILEFEAADRLHTQYFAAERVPAEFDWHYAHNLDLLGTSFMYLGQMRRAEQALKKSFALPTSTLIQTFNKRQWLLFLRGRGRYDEARAAAAVLASDANPVIRAAGRIESGHGHLIGKNFAQAAADANAAIAELRSAKVGAGLATIALESLQGEFYLRAGPREKGRQLLEAVVDKAGARAGTRRVGAGALHNGAGRGGSTRRRRLAACGTRRGEDAGAPSGVWRHALRARVGGGSARRSGCRTLGVRPCTRGTGTRQMRI